MVSVIVIIIITTFGSRGSLAQICGFSLLPPSLSIHCGSQSLAGPILIFIIKIDIYLFNIIRIEELLISISQVAQVGCLPLVAPLPSPLHSMVKKLSNVISYSFQNLLDAPA